VKSGTESEVKQIKEGKVSIVKQWRRVVGKRRRDDESEEEKRRVE
jgi:hypothetical protein